MPSYAIWKNPESMDILGTQELLNNEQDFLSKDSSHHMALEQWIQMAIDIEEKQYIIHVYVP